MDYCLIADELPSQVPGTFYAFRDPDYRHMVRFEAATLRAKTEQDAAQAIQTAQAALFGPLGQRPQDAQKTFDALLWFYRAGRKAPSGDAPPSRAELAIDYIIDGPMIAAAFEAAYGLDLTSPATRINWWRFQALLLGLPDECRFCKVVGWRTADLSGLKGKQLAFYQGMKQRFALPEDLGKGEKRVYASKADWDAAFIERLRRQAGKK